MCTPRQQKPDSGRLLLSIHDVGPRFEHEADMLHDLFRQLTDTQRFAMLVVPDHWGEAPLASAPAFRSRLRGWADAGVEIFVHGWFHRDTSRHSGLNGLKARAMTASEGEFLGLGHKEAARYMAEGKALIEDIIGRPAAGFIAPAWLYGEGAKEALAHSGFALAEDHMRVWQPGSGRVLARGPVITWASRSRPRQLSSLAFAALARQALRWQDTVRIAVHPGDTGAPALMRSITSTVSAFAGQRRVARYADLLD